MPLVGDWIKFNCGDQVFNPSDMRHVGRVESIRSGVTARVRWNETGWLSDEPCRELLKFNRRNHPDAE